MDGLEKAVSTIGGIISIIIVVALTDLLIPEGSPLVVASIGASAVLLFVVPHGQLSQPWPVLGGQVISAGIGVAVAMLFGTGALAAGLAVGLAILAMQQLKCIHPPGGATALTAVLGGEAITDMGFEFVVAPVLVNTVAILVVAVAFNAAFPWRRYPWYLTSVRPRQRRPPRGSTTPQGTPAAPGAAPATATATETADELTHRAVVEALRSVNSFIDVTEDDLVRLHRIISEIENDAGGSDASEKGLDGKDRGANDP